MFPTLISAIFIAGGMKMEMIDLNKTINEIDTDAVIARPLSARKVKRIIKRVAKSNKSKKVDYEVRKSFREH